MSDESDFVLIGRLTRAHGTGGEVRVDPVSDIKERFDALDYVLVDNGKGIRRLEVDSVRNKGGLVLLKLHGIDDRTSAEAFKGSLLGVKRRDVYPLPSDTYYVFDLVGTTVVGNAGRTIGVVTDVLKMPANDVLVLATDAGEALIPVVRSVVKEVDLNDKTIVIEEIPGLLD